MTKDISTSAIHFLAKKAVTQMERMGSQSGIGIALNAYTERQLVFEIGQQFRNKDKRSWVAFEQEYPTSPRKLKATSHEDNKDTTIGRADIVVLNSFGGTAKKENLWIEVKSTGVRNDGTPENSFSSFGWEHDFNKLGWLDSRVWNQTHYGYWVWLYLFVTYQDEIKQSFGDGLKWTKNLSLGEMSNQLGMKKGSGGLPLWKLLLNIEKRAKDSTCSCIPSFPYKLRWDTPKYSALLVTAKVK